MSQLVTDLLSRGAATLAGLLLVVATTVSLMRTVVVPRSLRSAISDAVSRTVVAICIGLARLRRSYSSRDGVLAWAGPSIIILQLLTWLVLYLFAYGLLIYGVSGQGFGNALRQAGSSLFTLGFAAVDTEAQTVVDFVAAATGPVVIAMLIGFLPTIYSAYLDREIDVTQLSSAAGDPTWGPELLARASLAETIDGLPEVFAGWSRWATGLRMTHVTYPVLVWVRSARANQHYIVALLAVMDAAALKLALTTKLPRTEAFTLLLEGGQALEVMFTLLFERRPWRHRIPFTGSFDGASPEIRREARRLPAWNRHMMAIQVASDMDALRGLSRDSVRALARGENHSPLITRADFDEGVELLRRADFPIDRDLDEAWEEFRVARSRYEFAAYEICRKLYAVPAPWSGDRSPATPTLWPTLAVDIVPLIDDGRVIDDGPVPDEGPA